MKASLMVSDRAIFSMLACPFDRGPLQLRGSELFCPACMNSVGHVDDNGVISFTKRPYYFREIPREFLEWLVLQENMLDELFLYACKDARNAWAASYAMDSNRATALFNCPLDTDASVLDFGSGWGNLARSLSPFVKQVVAMDMTYPSLEFSLRLAPKNIVHVHGGDGRYLPFEDNSFDIVVLNGVLEWIPESFSDKTPREAQIDMLREINRVLKDKGEVVIGMENRFSFLYWAGQKEDHIKLRFVSLFPRTMADIYARLAINKPYRNHTYSHYGLIKLLKDAGFRETRLYWPWWTYRVPWKVFPFSGKNYDKGGNLGAGVTLKRRLVDELGRRFAKYPRLRFLVPSYYIRGGKSELAKGFFDRTISHIEGKNITNRGVCLTGSNSLIAYSERYVYKIGLNLAQEGLLIDDFLNGERVGQIPSLTPFIPNRKKILCGNRSVLITPLFKPVKHLSPSICKEIQLFLDILYRLPKHRYPFRETILHGIITQFLDLIGVKGDWDRIFEIVGEMEVEVGAVHGDFHLRQLFLQKNRLKILDWDRFSLNGLYGCDQWSFAIDHWKQRRLKKWIDRWEVLVFHNSSKPAQVLGRMWYVTDKLGLASRVAFALQHIVANMWNVNHPIELGARQVSEIAHNILRIRELVETSTGCSGTTQNTLNDHCTLHTNDNGSGETRGSDKT